MQAPIYQGYGAAPVLRAGETLYRTSAPRFVATLAALAIGVALLCSVGFTFFMGDFSMDVFMISMAMTTFFFGTMFMPVLFLTADARGPNYLKLPIAHIECFERNVLLRDASGAVLGDLAAGTLRVARTNAQLGRMMAAGLRLDHAREAVHLVPVDAVGAWPGVVAAPQGVTHHRIDNRLYDELTRFAV